MLDSRVPNKQGLRSTIVTEHAGWFTCMRLSSLLWPSAAVGPSIPLGAELALEAASCLQAQNMS